VNDLRAQLDTTFVPGLRAGVLAALGELGWSLPTAGTSGRGATMPVPAGTWQLGRRGDAGQADVSTNSEARTIDLPAFRISRFPVSNAEYAAFIETRGYEDQSLWSAEGWEWRT
jgi:iron(II)-dependent oxidoreductase